MKTLTLILAVLLGVAAELPAQTDLIARIHFLGGDKISADPNHLAFTNEFCSPEAKALESQTLDKLSRAPYAWLKSKIAGTNDGSAQLRPLLDDLLKSEWIFEIRDTTNGSPEYALAIRLDKDRAEVWSKNLAAVLQNWTGSTVISDESGVWELKKHVPPNLIRFKRDGDFVVVDCGQNELSLGGIAKSAPETGWLSADLDWPRLARIFPGLNIFDFPKFQMRVTGLESNLMFNGKFTLAQPLPPPEKWRVPTNTIHQPFISFTAVRGVGPWLARQPWMRRFKLQPQPDQLFIWAQPQIAFQTFAAEPVPDARAALKQIENNFSGDTNWQNQLLNPAKLNVTTNEISFGIPFFAPSIRAVREPSGDFLLGGFFPNLFNPTPLPPDLLAHLNQPNLVYYHWEITSERLKVIPQLSQLLLMLTRHQELNRQSAAAKWLEHIGPTLGSSVTEVVQTAPNELAFSRRAPGGLTGLELRALASWLEATNFPGCDLKMPGAAGDGKSPAPGDARNAAGHTREIIFPMLKLGVNIDHVATVREARYRGRGFGEPDPVEAVKICEAAGAHGITAHLREDRRHIQDRDVWKLREVVKRLNLEMANAPEIISIALKLKPDIVCIVPERRLEVTTEGGLDVAANEKSLTATRKKMNDAGIEVSLFIAPDKRQIQASARTGAQFVELHTGQFAEEFQVGSSRCDDRTAQRAVPTGLELQRLIAGAKLAHSLGLGVNAGHGLNYDNLRLLHRVPHLEELNIGHSIVSRAVFAGMKTAVREMLALMKNYRA